MANAHEPPCVLLKQIQEDIVKAQETIREHERELGGVSTALKTLLDSTTKLFNKTDELYTHALQNRTNIEHIKDLQEDISHKMGNGFKEEILKSVHAATLSCNYSQTIDGVTSYPKNLTEFMNYAWMECLKKVAWLVPIAIVFILIMAAVRLHLLPSLVGLLKS